MYQSLPAVVENLIPSINENNAANDISSMTVLSNNTISTSMRDEIICCNVCGFTGCDVKLSDCGCSFHARCLELRLPNLDISTTTQHCQICSRNISKMALYAMSFVEIDEVHSSSSNMTNGNGSKRNRKRKNSPYNNDSLVRSMTPYDFDKSSEDSGLRTGRWTQEEMTFVDFLITKFEGGELPLSNGIKLNDFLATMLKSKQSRLTKKMKNAKLSSKSFKRTTGYVHDADEARKFSTLEEAFFNSLVCDEERAEMRFHMQREWRERMSTLCTGLGVQLDTEAWLLSIDEMHRRRTKAQEAMRKSRRRVMMGLALGHDRSNPDKGVFIQQQSASNSNTPTTNDTVSTARRQLTKFSTTCNYLAKVMTFMQENNVPFEHVDAWVPSLVTPSNSDGKDEEAHSGGIATANESGSQEDCRLCFAGCATAESQTTSSGQMQLLPETEHFNLTSFGEYSQKFSFQVGCGMPGRVYQSGIPTWEQSVQNAPLHHFERCGGALQWGVKTVVGIPVPSPNVGRIVVALYSRHDREKDQELVGRLYDEFSRLMPSPKWKLVVDLGPKVPPPAEMSIEEETVAQVTSPIQDSTSTAATNNQPEAIDPRIDAVVSLLGEHIPLDPMSPLGSYVPGFISFRLILLKTSWSSQEKELVTTLLDSFSSYTASGRARADIAVLLARDYMFLSQYYSQQPAQQQQNTNQTGLIGENTPLSLTHVNSENGMSSVGSSLSHPFDPNSPNLNGNGGALIPNNM